jgi:hypothetical protein
MGSLLLRSAPFIVELEPIEKHKLALPSDEVDKCLLALALNGGALARTVREMKAAGIKVSPDQLREWRDKFPKRYQWHATENAAKLEKDIIASQREIIAAATSAALDAVAEEHERIRRGDVKDAAATARNLATVVGISTTKLLELSGRPTSITEVRKPEEILKALKRKGFQVDVEGSAEDEEADAG